MHDDEDIKDAKIALNIWDASVDDNNDGSFIQFISDYNNLLATIWYSWPIFM